MFSALYNSLRQLDDSGPEGFEGLVKALLDGFAPGLDIAYLAKSGWQGGVDASDGGLGRSRVGLECKHYGLGSAPATRDLLGGLTAAVNGARDSLDAWLLVTTGAIGASAVKELSDACVRNAVTVEVIDWQAAGLPSLAILCAGNPTLTLTELAHRLPGLDAAAIGADLEAISHHPGFGEHSARLRQRLCAAEIGLAHATAGANAWIRDRLSSAARAKADFHQLLCPLDGAYAQRVERQGVSASLSRWYTGPSVVSGLAMVHGREGVGKSWAVMDWWARLPDPPLTLLITGNMALRSEDAGDVLAEALARQLVPRREPIFWRHRLDRWLTRPPTGRPLILVILDGLNERPAEDRAARLQSFAGEPWQGRVAVLASCWTTVWQERIRDRLWLGRGVQLTEVAVEPYNDGELAQALEPAGLRPSVLKERTRELLRVPRVCHLALSRFAPLLITDDLTVERMMVTDWQHRRISKTGLELTDKAFNQLVMAAARELREGRQALEIDWARRSSAFARHRSQHPALDSDLDEIIDGGLFFEPDPDSGGTTMRLRLPHVGLALGMLLADDVRRAAGTTADAPSAIEGVIAQWEPFDQFSDAGAVLRGAVAAGCLRSDYPQTGLHALLSAWLRLRNRPDDHLDDFRAFLPDRPEAWLDAVETVWAQTDRYPAGRQWLTEAIIHHLDRPEVAGPTIARANRWLGLWHRPPADASEQTEYARRIAERLGAANQAELALIERFAPSIEGADRSEIAELGILVASFRPRFEFVDGLTGWALVVAATDYPVTADEVAWYLRLNQTDPAETEAALFERVDLLLTGTAACGRKAAGNLLWALGTGRAVARWREFGGEYRLPVALWADRFPQALDPTATAPDMAAALAELTARDPDKFCSGPWRTEEDSHFEHLEHGLAAFCPRQGAEFARRVVRTICHRKGVPLRQLTFFINEHGLAVGALEAALIRRVHRRLLKEFSLDDKSEAFTETELTLALLPTLSAEDQYLLLCARPLDVFLAVDHESVFAVLPPARCDELLIEAVAADDLALLRAALSLLGRQSFALSEAGRAALVRCFDHEDSVVRLLALRLAITIKDVDVLARHRDGTWRASGEKDFGVQDHFGTVALGLAPEPVRYDRVRGRAALHLLGWLAERDGSEDAFRAFAGDIDALWQVLIKAPVADATRGEGLNIVVDRVAAAEPPPLHHVSSRDPELARQKPRRPGGPGELEAMLKRMNDPGVIDRELEERSRQTHRLLEKAAAEGVGLFAHPMHASSLLEVIRLRPELVDRWLEPLARGDGRTVLFRAGEFYRALALALAHHDPERAVKLMRDLHAHRAFSVTTVFKPLEITAFTCAAFEMPASAPVDALRREILDEAVTDEALFTLVLVAYTTDTLAWLTAVIREDAASGILARQARALTLIGWLDVKRRRISGRHRRPKVGHPSPTSSCRGRPVVQVDTMVVDSGPLSGRVRLQRPLLGDEP